jgi:hypothetical protein
MKALMPWAGADSLLARDVYGEPALVPHTTWLGGERPGAPDLTVRRLGDAVYVRLAPTTGDLPRVWHVRERFSDGWRVRRVPASTTQFAYEGAVPERLVVSAVSPLGLESAVADIALVEAPR